MDPDRYFGELDYLELSLLYAGPAKWTKWTAHAGKLGLVAPFSLTHRQPPSGNKLWPHDATTGDFRDSATSRATLDPLREAVTALSARAVVFRSPEGFSPSAGNRDVLRKFFTEIATFDVPRVWIPGGLWNVPTTVKLASELGVVPAIDPLVREPGVPIETLFELEVSALYLRTSVAVRSEHLEDLAALVEAYEELPVTVAFASPNRWQDARNLKKLL